ncbi:hypothetical protein [Cupriavidus sp. D384]|uniref:hypothetical protein n=1 Tax=Cupriavidus sp. D384 TaxID=1538095 RepID=UPI0012E7680F|nr:hypothetical protein [Cupriavidus sp. D384]
MGFKTASRKFTKAADCGMSGCGQPSAAGDLATFSVNANGGFDLTDASGTARAFGFKGVDGQLAIVIVHTNGFMVARHPVARALPVVGFTNAYQFLSDLGELHAKHVRSGHGISSAPARC